VLNQYELEAAGTRDGDMADARACANDMYAVLLFALFLRSTATNSDERWHGNSPRSTSGHHQDTKPVSSSSSKLLCRRRAALAEHLRATRKHSIVPVLASVLWFGIALAISVSKAFRTANASAYNLALGLLMSWLPPLVACAAVNRNPTNSQHARLALQQFLNNAATVAAVAASSSSADSATGSAAASAAVDPAGAAVDGRNAGAAAAGDGGSATPTTAKANDTDEASTATDLEAAVNTSLARAAYQTTNS
jgi:hypothetical protein